jgi:tRNA(Ile)-lysidine synthase
MYGSLKKNILSLNSYNKNIRIAVSYSGGADSGVLLYLTVKLFAEGLISKPAAVYFNHNLRGIESAAEERFIEKICSGYGIDVIKISLNVKDLSQKKSLTIETAARELRYKNYGKISENFDIILQGHHADDNSETVFFNIMRGSGLEGACGISRKRDCFLRPLLDFTKSEILDFAKKNKIEYVEDSTNVISDFSRNKIRNIIFPLIEKELNREVKNSLNGFSCSVAEARDFIDKTSEKIFSKIVRKHEGLSVVCLERFVGLEPALRTAVLQKTFKSTGFVYRPDRVKTSLITGNIMLGKNSVFQTEEYSVSIYGNSIIFLNRNKFKNKAEVSISEKRKSGFFIDTLKVKGNIYTDSLRDGEIFIPFGKKKAEKVTKVLSDKKIPKVLREYLLCLRDDEKVIFIQGAGISDSVKKDAGSDEVMYINVKNDILKKFF